MSAYSAFKGQVRFRLLATGLFLALAVPSFAKQRIALVLGNSAYTLCKRLANLVNDAENVGQRLKSLGFGVKRQVSILACLALLFVLPGCATQSQLVSLQAQNDQRGKELQILTAQWEDFRKNYSPEVRDELNQNMQAYHEKIKVMDYLNQHAVMVVTELGKTKEQANALLNQIEINRRESEYMNVVRRFDALQLLYGQLI